VVNISQGASPGELTTLLVSSANERYTDLRLGVDAQGRITSLLLSPAVDVDTGEITSWDRLDQRLGALHGAGSLAALDVSGPVHPAPIHQFRPGARLAVGSASNLCILGALAEMIRAGDAFWDQPLAIKDDLKSLPGGQMQLETEATEFPLSRYAELMISVSDNTAADHLMAFMGRPRVEDYVRAHSAPDPRNVPVLSTMEMFKLKLGPDPSLAGRYAAADERTRRNMLAEGGEVAATIPSFAAAAAWRAPQEIDRVEWFLTTAELAGVMADLHRLEQQPGMEPLRTILRENPGLSFDRERWTSVAYKGGSEPGVLNMTWLLERDDGRMFALAITWNDPKEPVELARLAELAGAAVRLLGKADR
jgi:beta-lactamase class A